MLKRPSCGRRFSEMSSLDISLSRSTSAGAILESASVCRCSMPSIRKRICRRPSCGSMWISDARTCVASLNMVCSSLTTGASSSPTESAIRPKSICTSPISSESSLASPQNLVGAAIDAVYGFQQLTFGNHCQFDVAHQDAGEFVISEQIRRIGHADQQRSHSALPAPVRETGAPGFPSSAG